MTNIRTRDELVVAFDSFVSRNLWHSVLNQTVEEADRLGFDLSQWDGGLNDPLPAFRELSVAIQQARMRYLRPFATEQEYKESLDDALKDGWADRLRDDVLEAWRETLLQNQVRCALPVSEEAATPSHRQAPIREARHDSVWSLAGAVFGGGLLTAVFCVLLLATSYKPFHGLEREIVGSLALFALLVCFVSFCVKGEPMSPTK